MSGLLVVIRELFNFLCDIRDFQLILTGVNNQVSYRAKRLILRSNILYSIREQTGNQCSSRSRGVIWHDFGAQ